MFQADHHNPCAQEHKGNLPKLLQTHSTHMAHINTIIPEALDPLQFAYCPNRSTDDAISIAPHTALSHLDKRNTYVRMLFIDYSSAFNTIVFSRPDEKRAQSKLPATQAQKLGYA